MKEKNCDCCIDLIINFRAIYDFFKEELYGNGEIFGYRR